MFIVLTCSLAWAIIVQKRLASDEMEGILTRLRILKWTWCRDETVVGEERRKLYRM